MSSKRPHGYSSIEGLKSVKWTHCTKDKIESVLTQCEILGLFEEI